MERKKQSSESSTPKETTDPDKNPGNVGCVPGLRIAITTEEEMPTIIQALIHVMHEGGDQHVSYVGGDFSTEHFQLLTSNLRALQKRMQGKLNCLYRFALI
jgi:hypothetical protein